MDVKRFDLQKRNCANVWIAICLDSQSNSEQTVAKQKTK